MEEQQGVAYRLTVLGNGKAVTPREFSPERLLEMVDEMLAPDGEAQQRQQWVRRVMEFEEVRGQQGLEYHIAYNARFHQGHLANRVDFQGLRVKCDLDILFAIALVLYFFYRGIRKVLCG